MKGECMMSRSKFMIIMMCILAGFACSKDKPAPLMVLDPPVYGTTQATILMREGNALFRAGKLEAARVQFQAAIQEQKDLAEAHYNLALTLDRMGNGQAAKQHYIEAANLAPGNKVIWNSPPLRRFGNVPDTPQEATSNPVLPGFGGAKPGGGGF